MIYFLFLVLGFLIGLISDYTKWRVGGVLYKKYVQIAKICQTQREEILELKTELYGKKLVNEENK